MFEQEEWMNSSEKGAKITLFSPFQGISYSLWKVRPLCSPRNHPSEEELRVTPLVAIHNVVQDLHRRLRLRGKVGKHGERRERFDALSRRQPQRPPRRRPVQEKRAAQDLGRLDKKVFFSNFQGSYTAIVQSLRVRLSNRRVSISWRVLTLRKDGSMSCDKIMSYKPKSVLISF